MSKNPELHVKGPSSAVLGAWRCMVLVRDDSFAIYPERLTVLFAKLTTIPPANTAPSADVSKTLLELNRSDLTSEKLRLAKLALLQDGGT